MIQINRENRENRENRKMKTINDVFIENNKRITFEIILIIIKELQEMMNAFTGIEKKEEFHFQSNIPQIIRELILKVLDKLSIKHSIRSRSKNKFIVSYKTQRSLLFDVDDENKCDWEQLIDESLKEMGKPQLPQLKVLKYEYESRTKVGQIVSNQTVGKEITKDNIGYQLLKLESESGSGSGGGGGGDIVDSNSSKVEFVVREKRRGL